uniref:Pancreatic lipase-related protein 2 n=1 Tax=Cacopsylla melanoneura TaxID=428564 RepID=A0A8D8TKH1_9HEMI
MLFTRTNPHTPDILRTGYEQDLRNSHMDIDLTTVFYIHGFTEQATGESGTGIRDAYLRRDDFNIILVDWSSLSAFPWYTNAASNTKVVGHFIASFIRFLVSKGYPLDRMHVIGFSLGAEIAGFTGKALDIGKLPRITGLDPAFPLYGFTRGEGHLSKVDANFVDVIHTDGGVLGFPIPIGHADFFPNGGFPIQPGCHIREVLKKTSIERFLACSHHRAWRFYAESITNERGFPATRCPDYKLFSEGFCHEDVTELGEFMGLAVSHSARGQYYLKTKPLPPFTRIARREFHKSENGGQKTKRQRTQPTKNRIDEDNGG